MAPSEPLTIAAGGDTMLNDDIRQLEATAFAKLLEQVRAADVAVSNLETLLHEYEGYPTGATTGTYMRAPPAVADALQWAGFDLFAAASNHSGDYTYDGMLATMRNLEQRDLPYAGLGRNLAGALEPAYVNARQGRVGLVAANSTIQSGSVAGEQRRDMQGRPGIAPLHHHARYVLPEALHERVRTISEELALEELKEKKGTSSFPHIFPEDGASYFELPNLDGANMRFETGEEAGIYRTLDEDDADALYTQIDRANRQADVVIASLHAHESPDGTSGGQEPAQFIERFARTSIDRGADCFIGHGAHVVQGIEIYDGAPIFYDLGNFMVRSQVVTRVPSEMYERYGVDPAGYPEDIFDDRVTDEVGDPKGFLADDGWWWSILPVCAFDSDGAVTSIDIYPIDLQREQPRSRRGIPLIAEDEFAEHILTTVKDLSEPYGTEITIDDGVGRIRR